MVFLFSTFSNFFKQSAKKFKDQISSSSSSSIKSQNEKRLRSCQCSSSSSSSSSSAITSSISSSNVSFSYDSNSEINNNTNINSSNANCPSRNKTSSHYLLRYIISHHFKWDNNSISNSTILLNNDEEKEDIIFNNNHNINNNNNNNENENDNDIKFTTNNYTILQTATNNLSEVFKSITSLCSGETSKTYDIEILFHSGRYELERLVGLKITPECSCNSLTLKCVNPYGNAEILGKGKRIIDVSGKTKVVMNRISIHQTLGNHYTTFFQNCNVYITSCTLGCSSQSSVVIAGPSTSLEMVHSIIENGKWSCLRIDAAKQVSVRFCDIRYNADQGVDLSKIYMDAIEMRWNRIHHNGERGVDVHEFTFSLTPSREQRYGDIGRRRRGRVQGRGVLRSTATIRDTENDDGVVITENNTNNNNNINNRSSRIEEQEEGYQNNQLLANNSNCSSKSNSSKLCFGFQGNWIYDNSKGDLSKRVKSIIDKDTNYIGFAPEQMFKDDIGRMLENSLSYNVKYFDEK